MGDVTRRRAVKVTAAGAAVAFAAGSVQAQGGARKGGQRHSGSSQRGDLQEALTAAIQAALAAAPGAEADRQVRWTLKEVSGVNGGFLAQNTVTVEIEATVT
ncbi:MAG: hypothetical protein JO284_16340 [Planctomycetaceae bacterium]|nr:hypothetical protein [Planctomycetaceae bacterium]MBV8317726.1 hypothetical protein [Planctomycetaceae bacterium]